MKMKNNIKKLSRIIMSIQHIKRKINPLTKIKELSLNITYGEPVTTKHSKEEIFLRWYLHFPWK